MAVFETFATAVPRGAGLLAKTGLCETCAADCGTELFMETGVFTAFAGGSGLDISTAAGLRTPACCFCVSFDRTTRKLKSLKRRWGPTGIRNDVRRKLFSE